MGFTSFYDGSSSSQKDELGSILPKRRSALGLLVRGFLFLLLCALPLSAQTPPPEVEYADDFQSYQRNDNPPGWFDTSVGKPQPKADGLYKVRTDPTEGTNGSNLVYGTVQASGMPTGETPRIGTFSTLTTHTFDGTGRFEYSGRLIRTRKDSVIGLTFFSSYPEVDSYYMIGLWSRAESNNLTMQWFSPDDRLLGGSIDSGVTLEPNTWYRFYIQADALPTVTRVRAKFWVDGDPEPSEWQIDGFDDDSSRLTSGRIGMWAAVRGESYVDDLWATSPIDVTPPEITVTENDLPLENGAMFNRDATPVITVVDDIDSSPSWQATLDGESFEPGLTVTAEGFHRLEIEAFDAVLNRSAVAIDFVIDKTPPQVAFYEGDNTLDDGAHLNRTIVPRLYVIDLTATIVTATLNGALYEFGPVVAGTNYREGPPVGDEGTWELHTLVTDVVGWQTESNVTFVIDKTPPAITLDSHEEAAVLATVDIVLAGAADDAIVVTVNGSGAAIDPLTRRWSLPVSLVEGANGLSIRAEDRAGNMTTMQRSITLDTTAPSIAFLAPVSGACSASSTLDVLLRVSDATLDSVRVDAALATTFSTFAASNGEGTWSASIPVETDGKVRLTATAIDRAGNQRAASVEVKDDRTAPVIEILDNGEPLTQTLVARPVTPQVRIADLDPEVSSTVILDGEPYQPGTPITVDGPHSLAVNATDCAGNTAESSVTFTIDTVAPAITSTEPPSDALVGSIPQSLSGTAGEELASVSMTKSDGSTHEASVSGQSFTFSSPGFSDGTNRLTLEATDAAGNSSQLAYVLTISIGVPSVEIVESAGPIRDGSIYRRAITPIVRSSDPDAAITATLNGSAFTSGTTISADGNWTIEAEAADSLGHVGSASVSFTIDATPPAVAITSPLTGAVIAGPSVSVAGTVSGATSVSVNGARAAITGSNWSTTVQLDLIDTMIAATAEDAAGNRASATVEIQRPSPAPVIVLTSPRDGSRTNRRLTVVDGFVPSESGANVNLSDAGGQQQTISVDASGRFRFAGWTLDEGTNVITATVSDQFESSTSASVTVTVDFRAPALSLLANGALLREDDQFAVGPSIATSASDPEGAVTTSLRIDSVPVIEPHIAAGDGWHTAIAVAIDAAGNQTRVERRFLIGEGTSSTGCFIDGLDPIDGSAIESSTTSFSGRVGGAAGATVNGAPVTLEDGSFCTSINLPDEGSNVITVRCTDVNGSAVGDESTVVLNRVTGAPSISIVSPVSGSVTADTGGTIHVSGTASGATEVLVNGKLAMFDGTSFETEVVLTDGINQISAVAINALGKSSTATRSIRFERNLPRIVVTSPVGIYRTGAPVVQISGAWVDLEPDTLKTGTVAASIVRDSDTSGRFIFNDVPVPGGPSTLTIIGKNSTGRTASADVTIDRDATRPWIVVDSPFDRVSFPSGVTSVVVQGRAAGANASTIDVNGSIATLTASGPASEGSAQPNAYSFEASVPLSDLSSLTPIVARITQPDGAGSSFVIAVQRLAGPPAIAEVSPHPGAGSIDPAVLPLILFDHAMDPDSVRSAFSLTMENGSSVAGNLVLDGKVLSFAPASPLATDENFTMTITAEAHDIAGTSLGSSFTSTFTTIAGAPETAPTIDPVGVICARAVTIGGTAPSGARIRIDQGTLTLNTNASSTGSWQILLPIDGPDGYRLVRARIEGVDGSLSPPAASCLRVSCDRLRVVDSSFDRDANQLIVNFSSPIDPATIDSDSVRLVLATGPEVLITNSVSGSTLTITPSTDLTTASFTLHISTSVARTDGTPLDSPFQRTFTAHGDEPVAGDGEGVLSGAVRTGELGRPLDSASVEASTPTGAYARTDEEEPQ